MNMRTTASAIVFFFALTAPVLAQDAKSIVDAENQKWIVAYKKGDAAALTALYTKDAVRFTNETAKPVVGSDNILKLFQAELSQPTENLTLTSTETRSLSADRLLDAGVWGIDIPQKDGPALHLTGPYLDTFVRQGSTWLIQTDGSGTAPKP
jgi:ketosteroid isomerase-like protein